MEIQDFIIKWKKSTLKEKSSSQENFIDLCGILAHKTPAEMDPDGDFFTFERGASKHGGGEGWADVWKKGFFGWEYKGKHKDLNDAYDQLLRYRDSLENPPLLVVSDIERIIIRTNFTGTASVVHEINLEAIGEQRNLEILRSLFFEPEKLRPGRTSISITQEAASMLAEIAQSISNRGLDPFESAHFLNRLVFCLFAEDIGLLPEMIFSKIIEKSEGEGIRFSKMLSHLFETMAKGGEFGLETIRHFNGNLFDNARVIDLNDDELKTVMIVSKLDWSFVEPSIIGTLFERGLDPAKRSQLGAQYTSREDIEVVVENLMMMHLRKDWEEVKATVISLLARGEKNPQQEKTGKKLSPGYFKKTKGEADLILHRFLQKIGNLKVLDPACGSGNFLYVALQKLKELEKEVLIFAADHELGGYLPLVRPWQMFGIEINPYAYELAQTTVWIGYLQWVKFNGYGIQQDPVLQPMAGNFKCMDSILDHSDPENPKEPEWPSVDFIIGNPPFLGGKLLRRELKDEYVDKLFQVWNGRIPAEADLCCYWFEKARSQIEKGKCKRVGLLATQGIRGGANREVLKRIRETGNIFFAESDRPWILNGANVHISMIGFDNGNEKEIILNGKLVSNINPDLTSESDISTAKSISSNFNIGFMGDTKVGPFEISEREAIDFLMQPNPNKRPNSDVLRPWINGLEITRRPQSLWIVDFTPGINEFEASKYQIPFEHISKKVKPYRASARSGDRTGIPWWIHQRPRPEMRLQIEKLKRFLVTVRVAKHRIFVWRENPVLPDCATIAFARPDDFFFGVLQSRIHEVWALGSGTQLEDRPRYTPTTCFETFPFPPDIGLNPFSPNAKAEAIAAAANSICELRENWLNPSEWTREEVLEFPATVGGIWTSHIEGIKNSEYYKNAIRESDTDTVYDATIEEFHMAEENVRAATRRSAISLNQGDTAMARYVRKIPKDAECAKKLEKRTLTLLYNERPGWLQAAHQKLDKTVFAAYGWPSDLADEQIIVKLLELNHIFLKTP